MLKSHRTHSPDIAQELYLPFGCYQRNENGRLPHRYRGARRSRKFSQVVYIAFPASNTFKAPSRGYRVDKGIAVPVPEQHSDVPRKAESIPFSIATMRVQINRPDFSSDVGLLSIRTVCPMGQIKGKGVHVPQSPDRHSLYEEARAKEESFTRVTRVCSQELLFPRSSTRPERGCFSRGICH